MTRRLYTRGRLIYSGLPFLYAEEVRSSDESARLDSFVGRLPMVGSRSRAQKLLDKGYVRVNRREAKASQKLKTGDTVLVRVPAPEPLKAVPEDIPLDILYEDSDLIVVNKPRGMVVHPASGNWSGTLVNGLLRHCSDLSGIGGVARPGIVHRIDKDTSGVLVVAKNDAAHGGLASQLKVHSMKRIYIAVVVGEPKADKGRVETMIGRHPADRKKMSVVQRGGKTAVTNWSVIERLKGYCMIEARLETGRTHQIRVHMAHIGLPLLGDPIYGPRNSSGGFGAKLSKLIQGQALHAAVLGFIHPGTGGYLEFAAPLPCDMLRVMDELRNGR